MTERLWRLVSVGVVLMVVAEPVALLGQTTTLAPSRAFDAGLARDVLLTSYGHIAGLRLGAALGLWALAGAVCQDASPCAVGDPRARCVLALVRAQRVAPDRRAPPVAVAPAHGGACRGIRRVARVRPRRTPRVARQAARASRGAGRARARAERRPALRSPISRAFRPVRDRLRRHPRAKIALVAGDVRAGRHRAPPLRARRRARGAGGCEPARVARSSRCSRTLWLRATKSAPGSSRACRASSVDEDLLPSAIRSPTASAPESTAASPRLGISSFGGYGSQVAGRSADGLQQQVAVGSAPRHSRPAQTASRRGSRSSRSSVRTPTCSPSPSSREAKPKLVARVDAATRPERGRAYRCSRGPPRPCSSTLRPASGSGRSCRTDAGGDDTTGPTLVTELETPAAVVDIDRLERNLGRWQAECDRIGLANRPHVKTHKCVEIARRQIAHGAVGVHVSDAVRSGNDGRCRHRRHPHPRQRARSREAGPASRSSRACPRDRQRRRRPAPPGSQRRRRRESTRRPRRLRHRPWPHRSRLSVSGGRARSGRRHRPAAPLRRIRHIPDAGRRDRVPRGSRLTRRCRRPPHRCGLDRRDTGDVGLQCSSARP